METERVCPLCGDEKVNELRAEVKRLRDALRDVAELQREACAWRCDDVLHEKSVCTPNDIRSTPLVMKEEAVNDITYCARCDFPADTFLEHGTPGNPTYVEPICYACRDDEVAQPENDKDELFSKARGEAVNSLTAGNN